MQELYWWATEANAAMRTLALLHILLSYMHTLFEEASQKGLPVARPLWLAFPEEVKTHRVDGQWMLGGDILVAPVLKRVFSVSLPTSPRVSGTMHSPMRRCKGEPRGGGTCH